MRISPSPCAGRYVFPPVYISGYAVALAAARFSWFFENLSGVLLVFV